jgi:hypothetical protein
VEKIGEIKIGCLVIWSHEQDTGLEMFQVELLFIISRPTIVTSSYKGRPWVIKKSLNDDAPV